MLTAVMVGLFSAAFATRAAWETARPLPAPAQTRALLAEILPEQEFTDATSAPALFVVYGQPLTLDMAGWLLLGDGGEYGPAGVGGSVNGPPALAPARTVETVRHNLAARGWKLYPDLVREVYSCAGPPCDPTTIPTSTTIQARRGDTAFTMEVFPTYTGNTTSLAATFTRTAPWPVYPAAVAGGLLGAAAAYLLFAWVARRAGDRRSKILLGVALVCWWGPTLLSFPTATAHHFSEPHPSAHPLWEWLGQPTFSLLFLIGCACALTTVAMAFAREWSSRATPTSWSPQPPHGR
ncbi:hypothetical protein Asi02nite_76640 [Asanoa siamensis]|uniref:Uncharacterized protein n=1 Tax=Asanoa siamensis TaxID=926357 RepID=A0ABQ4D3N7_9ACTN|nr:hypothetical protein Asi02nite_76640 [Asanoa siamensis]